MVSVQRCHEVAIGDPGGGEILVGSVKLAVQAGAFANKLGVASGQTAYFLVLSVGHGAGRALDEFGVLRAQPGDLLTREQSAAQPLAATVPRR